MPHVCDLGGQLFQGGVMGARLDLRPDQVHRRVVGNGNRETTGLARPILWKLGQSGILQFVQVPAVGRLAAEVRVVDGHKADNRGTAVGIRGGKVRRWQGFEPA